MSEYIVECESIGKSYAMGKQQLEVLRGASLRLPEGNWTMLLGASGSGKTTLLNIVGALEKPDSGMLKFQGSDYSSFRASELRGRHFGFVFQSYHLLPELTVLENVMLPARLIGDFKSAKRAEHLVERVGLSQRARHRPGELSGGECQRAAIARSLINNPELLLADEPTGNLDAANGESIMALFGELHRSEKLSIIMITHNPALGCFADTILCLADGAITAKETEQ